jgi:ADP-ribose pyrophosphatase YjhB (NUDIX family)
MPRMVFSNTHGHVDAGETIEQAAARECIEETRGLVGCFGGEPRVFKKLEIDKIWLALSKSEFHRCVPRGHGPGGYLAIINLGDMTAGERLALCDSFRKQPCKDMSCAEARNIQFIKLSSLCYALQSTDVATGEGRVALTLGAEEQMHAVDVLQEKIFPDSKNPIESFSNTLMRDSFQEKLRGEDEFLKTVMEECQSGTFMCIKDLPNLSVVLSNQLKSWLTNGFTPTLKSETEHWLTNCSKCGVICGLWSDQVEALLEGPDSKPIFPDEATFECNTCQYLESMIKKKCYTCKRPFMVEEKFSRNKICYDCYKFSKKPN